LKEGVTLLIVHHHFETNSIAMVNTNTYTDRVGNDTLFKCE